MQLHIGRHTMGTRRNGEVDTASTLEAFQNAIGERGDLPNQPACQQDDTVLLGLATYDL